VDKKNQTGKRLKFARSLTQLSASGFCKRHGISLGTLAKQEANLIILTTKAAERIILALKAEQVDCTVEWLLDGQGEYPFLCFQSKNLNFVEEKDLSDFVISHLKEVEYFKKLNPFGIVTQVTDHVMRPFYEKGDYVGGIFTEGDFSRFHQEHCIIQKKTEESFVRKVACLENKLILYGTNNIDRSKHAFQEMAIHDIKKIVKIIWVRKPDQPIKMP
jgi:transcriptional regulator with XRE-family HTH domain